MRVLVVVSGRVQGVWFRRSCHDEAVRLGLGGWVRNRDRAVEAAVEGPPDAVDALVAWMAHGPPLAEVTDVVRRDVAPLGERRFRIR